MKKIQDLFQLELFRHGIRYVAAGAWNTVFGVGSFTVLVIIFSQKYYLLLTVICHILSVTNAFLCYKYFVFKSKGPFWKEYFKCYLVYGAGMLISTAEMFLCVSILKFDAIYSNIGITILNFCVSYFGHKYFSFNSKKKTLPMDTRQTDNSKAAE